MMSSREQLTKSADLDPSSFSLGHGRFRPLAFLGRGSMGQVYKVHDEELGIAVALKTLRDSAPEQIYHLKNEFRALAGVVHPNLVQLFELLIDAEGGCFTMELVDGDDFVAHVRQSPAEEAALGRFLDASVQLLCGLRTVHAIGRLHRDVKPSNLRVTHEGRVVLLDFDLVIAVGQEGRSVLPSAAAGTFAYMPPETLWGEPIGPPADLYSAGVVFYEALTGRLPHEDTALIGLQPPAPPRRIAPWVPEWLEELTLALLHREPDRRPSLDDVLLRLRSALPTRAAADHFMPGRREFLGREGEMDWLRGRAAAKETIVLRVSGTSGIGKSELLRRFTDELDAAGDSLVLRGRCHPQESVPYKALDAIVDGLSRFLSRQPEWAVREVLPRHMGALAKVFPVLGRIDGVDGLLRQVETIDATELRRRAFEALRQMLSRLATKQRLVFWIDDVQWGDTDSAALLADLLRPPEVPSLLLILSYRSEDEAGIDLLRALESLGDHGEAPRLEHLDVGPLDADVARDLAARLCPTELRDSTLIDSIAAEARGAPFLVAELARYLRHHPGESGGGAVDFAGAIGRRLDDLPVRARHLVELVAVAGAPLERSILLEASRDGEPGRAIVALLESESLVRTTTLGERFGVEAYHDRIREGVLKRLAGDQLVDRHRALAVALEASGRATPEELAGHFHGASMDDKAADYAVAAAERANDALAFVRAAEFFRSAREWGARDGTCRSDLLTREGEALSNGACFERAARAFLAAVPEAPRARALDLRRRASEQLLAAGHLDEGVVQLSGVLQDLGLEYPRTPGRATFAALQRLAGFAWRGIEPRPRTREASQEELLRIDACYAAGKCLVNSDAVRGVYLSVEALRHALTAGEPTRLGCSLAVVGGSISVIEGPLLARLGRRMMNAAEGIANATGSPLVRGTMDVGNSQVLLLRGSWRASLDHAMRGAQILSESCRGAAYECASARRIALRAMEELGDLEGLAGAGWQLLRGAIDLGDRYSEVAAAQQLSTALLAGDDTKEARRYARAGFEMSADGFYTQHFYSLRQQAYCDLYEGRAADSFSLMQSMWKRLQRSGLLRISLPRIDAHDLRGRLALAVASVPSADPSALHRQAKEAARRLRREAQDHAIVRACFLEAALGYAKDERALAVSRLEEAAAASRRASMRLHEVVADYRRGQILGGVPGRELTDRAAAIMREIGVSRPDRWVAVYAPGEWP
jgi:eukaryotic-like serine/threonine-protein kinase